VGRVLFAWYKGSALDRNAKLWRLAADVFNDLAMLLDMLSAVYTQYFLFLICAGMYVIM
jgi:hypothetical protein